ncbi:CDP-glycerol glycerophosphotransferase family protein, partial [Patescibacteria group bacterium]|nr:CDP-glycerol glycerophosphotransferase family protein [Patescibacteria group bacterium]
PAFDGYKRRPAYRSIKRFEEFEHFQDVLKSGALPRAYSFKQLDEFIGNYMKDQNIFADSRRILRERSCSFLDGLSSERILSEIKNV